MRKVQVFLDEERAAELDELAKTDYRSVKSMAELILMHGIKHKHSEMKRRQESAGSEK